MNWCNLLLRSQLIKSRLMIHHEGSTLAKTSHRVPTLDAKMLQQKLQALGSPQITDAVDESWNAIQWWIVTSVIELKKPFTVKRKHWISQKIYDSINCRRLQISNNTCQKNKKKTKSINTKSLGRAHKQTYRNNIWRTKRTLKQ